ILHDGLNTPNAGIPIVKDKALYIIRPTGQLPSSYQSLQNESSVALSNAFRSSLVLKSLSLISRLTAAFDFGTETQDGHDTFGLSRELSVWAINQLGLEIRCEISFEKSLDPSGELGSKTDKQQE
ncbi:unnamed protein product, partial [Rhizoctonia solani]